jgi:Mlc titration factor MtfA (ptsG expression regulator)
MLFRWLKRRRRRRILAQPFPSHWSDWLEENVVHYRRLDSPLQSRLRELIQVFIAEKHWEGLEGLVITEEMQVTIAALAGLLVVGRPDELNFDHVLSILVYPDVFIARSRQQNEFGLVTEGREARAGEAWYRGPVILSWEDCLADARQEYPGGNVVLHEFAHQLDMAHGGHVDGTPTLRNRAEYARWFRVMGTGFETLRDRCRQRHPTPVDCYGTKNPAEFFAVVTETFFERPFALRQHFPEVYELLRDFYQLDPATWHLDGS